MTIAARIAALAAAISIYALVAVPTLNQTAQIFA